MTIIVDSEHYAECENSFIVLVDNNNLHESVVGYYEWFEITDKETNEPVEFVGPGQRVNRTKRQIADIDSVEFIQTVRQICLDAIADMIGAK